MVQYFAMKENITEVVIELRDDVTDFADYGCCIIEPKHKRKVYGWVKTQRRIDSITCGKYGLFPD